MNRGQRCHEVDAVDRGLSLVSPRVAWSGRKGGTGEFAVNGWTRMGGRDG